MSGFEQTEGWSYQLKLALQHLHSHPCTRLPNPSSCQRRASVALILRVRPPPQHKSAYNSDLCSNALPFEQRLNSFFQQTWVSQGVLETLFIKRATRRGDRWTSQIAFPGGKREEIDSDDQAAGIRETMEETGVNLLEEWCLNIGNLPERLITAAWGKKPLMVLCPFVYLLLRYDIPPLDLQPSEVDSVHWVPLLSILSPSSRSFQTVDVSDRISPSDSPMIKSVLRVLGGQMIFSAVRLKASESKYCVNPEDTASKIAINPSIHSSEQQLVLWGLTLGMLADFTQSLEPERTAMLWSWPTFTHWDIRFLTWMLTRLFRKKRMQELANTDYPSKTRFAQGRIGDTDSTSYSTLSRRQENPLQGSIAGAHLLDSYFEQMRRAIFLAASFRLGLSFVVLAILLRPR